MRASIIDLVMSLTFQLLQTFSAHLHNKYVPHVKFYWNQSTKYRDITSCETGLNEQKTDGNMDYGQMV